MFSMWRMLREEEEDLARKAFTRVQLPCNITQADLENHIKNYTGIHNLILNGCVNVVSIPNTHNISVLVVEKCPKITSIICECTQLNCIDCISLKYLSGSVYTFGCYNCPLIDISCLYIRNTLVCKSCTSITSIRSLPIVSLSCENCKNLSIENIGYLPNINSAYTDFDALKHSYSHFDKVNNFRKLNLHYYKLIIRKELGTALTTFGAGGFTEDFVEKLLEF